MNLLFLFFLFAKTSPIDMGEGRDPKSSSSTSQDEKDELGNSNE